MKKLIPTALLGVAGATAIGLIGLQTPAVNADEALKREDDAVELVLVADDDDDDTNDDDTNDDDTDDEGGDTRSRSRETNDSTNSRHSAVSRDRDLSRGDRTRDWTRDGGEQKRDWSAHDTNDRSRNDTRR
jgi:hypothetical protein